METSYENEVLEVLLDVYQTMYTDFYPKNLTSFIFQLLNGLRIRPNQFVISKWKFEIIKLNFRIGRSIQTQGLMSDITCTCSICLLSFVVIKTFIFRAEFEC